MSWPWSTSGVSAHVRCLFVRPSIETQVGGHIMAARGAAIWRGERRMCCWWTHEQASVTMTMLTASHHRHRRHAGIEVDVQAGALMFTNCDLESASEEADALNLKEHIFEVMEEILPEHVKTNSGPDRQYSRTSLLFSRCRVLRLCLYFLKVDIPLLSSPQCHGRLQQGKVEEIFVYAIIRKLQKVRQAWIWLPILISKADSLFISMLGAYLQATEKAT